MVEAAARPFPPGCEGSAPTPLPLCWVQLLRMRNPPQVRVRTCLAPQRPLAPSSQSAVG